MLPALRKELLFSVVLLLIASASFAQLASQTLNARNAIRCATMERMNDAIKKDPSLPGKNGESKARGNIKRIYKENRLKKYLKPRRRKS